MRTFIPAIVENKSPIVAMKNALFVDSNIAPVIFQLFSKSFVFNNNYYVRLYKYIKENI